MLPGPSRVIWLHHFEANDSFALVLLEVVNLRIRLVVDKLSRARHIWVRPLDQLLRLDEAVGEDDAISQHRHNSAYLVLISVFPFVINTNGDSVLVEASNEISKSAHLSIQILIFLINVVTVAPILNNTPSWGFGVLGFWGFGVFTFF